MVGLKVKKKLEKEVMSMEEILTYFPKKIEKQNVALKNQKMHGNSIWRNCYPMHLKNGKMLQMKKKILCIKAQELYQEYITEKKLLENKPNNLIHQMIDAEKLPTYPLQKN